MEIDRYIPSESRSLSHLPTASCTSPARPRAAKATSCHTSCPKSLESFTPLTNLTAGPKKKRAVLFSNPQKELNNIKLMLATKGDEVEWGG